ncbi:PAB-dependent poly(A)-specific ribonuclease subunit PAN3 [Acipenser ruthenus]|uniref:PAB-dependent poly(A)-specific ribonuclease subunit PAN3 n=1 Tax=Acipenser ruthenus TaxID=7906 RepID=A0A662YNK0_ACIRT|nr:PAB-dependent poly(A)-specific ribonuclease subunit PAN3 [Acipenser ruthenus]
MNSGLPASAAPLGGICIPGVKLKYCRYYAKDKTCFYGDECQFLHEEPSMAGLAHHASGSPVPLSMVGPAVGAAAGYPHAGAGTAGAGGGGGTKKIEPLGAAGVGLEGQLLAIPGMDGGALAEASLTNSYFSSSFIGVNGFGSPAEPKYSMMQAPNPAASEFIPKGVSTPRMSNVSQSNMPAFSTALFSHPSMGSTSAAALGPGMSLSAGSSPLHSPKTTPHTSPAPRRRSHTPNPANYMVPTSASNPGSDPASQIIQKETVGGTTYFYTDTTPAPLAGMVFPQYHVYPPTAPHVAYMQPKANAPSFFMSDELRQQADLISLGKVVLALACNSLAGIQRENLQKAMELVSINYSSDLKNLILYLLTEQNRLRSVNDIMPMIGARFYTQLDASQMRNDVIEEDLAKEVQNGRLFRLLAKLGTINERPEFQKDPTWSETGDRYLLKLFRDHLFHQVTEAGTPWIDLSHIVSCLNKLDSGVPEKISLVSRDEKSILVVTYADLKRCFESTFQELQAAANGQL